MFPVNYNIPLPVHPATDATSSVSVSQTTATPLIDDDILLYMWERNAPPGGGERRDEAARKIRECREGKKTSLDLSQLGLSSLPNELPEQIKELNVDNNKLKALPDRLPTDLRYLSVSGNKLTDIPVKMPEYLCFFNASYNEFKSLTKALPDKVTHINLFHNKLSEVPDNLPPDLRKLDLGGNQIVSLDKELPVNLEVLCLSNNQLESVTVYFPASLREVNLFGNNLQTLSLSIMQSSPNTVINVEDNPFSEQTLRELINTTNSTTYTGPKISFSKPKKEECVSPPLLSEARQEEAFNRKDFLTWMADNSPETALEAITAMVEDATISPHEVAMLVRPENDESEHAGSLLAGVIAGGRMEPLAESWISLLHLLYEKKYLSGQEIISALLPYKEEDSVNSLAHAIVGTA